MIQQKILLALGLLLVLSMAVIIIMGISIGITTYSISRNPHGITI